MAAMLGSHTGIHTIPTETAVFFGDDSAADIRDFLHRERDRDAPTKPVICEKTPPHVHHTDRILTEFPTAKIVLMTRDGRDVVASLRRAWGSLDDSIARWVRDTIATLAAAAPERVRLVRYEALLQGPASVLADLCAFLGVPYQECMLHFHERAPHWFGLQQVKPGDASGQRGHTALRNWQVHQPLFDGSGRWRRDLQGDDLAKFERAAANAGLCPAPKRDSYPLYPFC
jgi:hypothetical protein